MISCSAWVARDVVRTQAGKKPTKGLLTDAEINQQSGLAGESEATKWEDMAAHGGDMEEEGEEEEGDMDLGSKAGKGGSDVAMRSVESGLAGLNMEGYDEEDGESGFITSVYGGERPGGAAFASNKDDPHIDDDAQSSDSEDEQDLVLRETDHMILAAKNEEDLSQLEVWVYEDLGTEGNLYVHHDIILPAFALSVASGDFDPRDPSTRKPMCAISTFDPEIELWDLTTVDSLQPAAVLGGYEQEGWEEVMNEAAAEEAEEKKSKGKKGKKGKKKKSKKNKVPSKKTLKAGSHEDAVLSLAWNWEFRNVLASGSADKTLKTWDLERLECVNTLTHHTDKVQSICWNPQEAQVILSGGFDKEIHLSDMRNASNSDNTSNVKWQLEADVETLIWDINQPTCFLVSCEDGSVLKFDTRMGSESKPVWTVRAHTKTCCGLSLCTSSKAKGLLATGSLDKMVKLWDVSTDEPSLVVSKKLKTGPVFTAQFCSSEDSPLLSVGGARGELMVWDVRSAEEIVKKYPGL
jgi:periodic tryptophan protein 1